MHRSKRFLSISRQTSPTTGTIVSKRCVFNGRCYTLGCTQSVSIHGTTTPSTRSNDCDTVGVPFGSSRRWYGLATGRSSLRSLPLLSTPLSSPPSLSSSSLSLPSSLLHNGRQVYRNPFQSTTTIRTNVFVSRHNRSLDLTASHITDYCRHHGLIDSSSEDQGYRTTNSHVVLKECPFCSKPTHNKADNLYKLYVKVGLGGGAYFCHRCGAKGSWYDFKMKLGGYQVVDAKGGGGGGDGGAVSDQRMGDHRTPSSWDRDTFVGGGETRYGGGTSMASSSTRYHGTNRSSSSSSSCLPMPSPRLQAAYITNLMDGGSKHKNNSQNDKYAESSRQALRYLTETRGLTKQTLRKYGVGLGTYNFPSTEPGSSGRYVREDCITFPWIMRASEVHEQELLRGGSYQWDDKSSSSSSDNKSLPEQNDAPTTNSSTSSSSDNKSLPEQNDAPTTTTSTTNTNTNTNNNNERERAKTERIHGPYTTRRLKARSLTNKSHQRLDPPGGGWGLFGWHTVPPNATSLVLTEGEYDAMAVYQATGRPTVSLPNGCRSLPVEVLPMLERFERIYLWMDDDGPGREGAEQFAKKIGVERCWIVRPYATEVTEDGGGDGGIIPKDANEALLMGNDVMDLERCIQEAKILPHDRILTFAEMRAQVLDDIVHPEKNAGVPVKTLPKFTKLVKGFRRGELTVLTGPTGSGKTTFLGQLSIDFAEQNVNTLWGSFEIKNTRLMHKLLNQFSRKSLPQNISSSAQTLRELESLADRFENLPLYFLKFHGGTDVDDVLDAMEYAAYVHDVQHVILDNLQFMLTRKDRKGGGGYSSSFDKFDDQDIALERFRRFATEKNVHVTLVVHPRKEDENARLGMSSIYGSAKATQEADTVLILQYDGKNKSIEVKKNRFDGTLGTLPLYFRGESKRYDEEPDIPEFARRAQASVRGTGLSGGGGGGGGERSKSGIKRVNLERVRVSPPINPTWKSVVE